MKDVIIILIIVIVIGAAIGYIIHAKKSGKKCIGCPFEGDCSTKANNKYDCGCGCKQDNK